MKNYNYNMWYVVQDNTNSIHSLEYRTDLHADQAIYSTSILSQLIPNVKML
jgi:hypothetical protein